MKCRYPERDITQRLDNTVNRYKGVPYLVRHVGGNVLELRDLVTGNRVGNIESDDDYFDISSVPLGFMQLTHGVVYVSRLPARMYKQGVCHDNIRWSFLNDDTRNLSGKECSFNNKGFKDMIQGVYPSLEEALKLLPSKGRNHEIAISNNIALVWKEKLRLTYVYYKTEEHGFIVDGTRKVIVPKDEFGWVISHYLSGFDWEVE